MTPPIAHRHRSRRRCHDERWKGAGMVGARPLPWYLRGYRRFLIVSLLAKLAQCFRAIAPEFPRICLWIIARLPARAAIAAPPQTSGPVSPYALMVSADRARAKSRAACILGAYTAFALFPAGAADLIELSLEQLANIEVTSVSRRAERLADAAASIYVITNDDIRRSGVTSLPEALRLAPNLHVARTSASGYTISARGFNNSAGNKLLVL